jgi:predicted metal-dependent phosphoesterase TrpH
MKEIKLDLHSHSILSYDGGNSANDYREALDSGRLDQLAITDHNEIAFALELQKELPAKIIVGEEIMCAGNIEIIGLFLKSRIAPGKSITKTITAIKIQGGLVYIPHPLDTWRHGIGREKLLQIINEVDIIESYNGRSYSNKASRVLALEIVNLNQNIVNAASSDAHSKHGLGKAYTEISGWANVNTLIDRLKKGNFHRKHAGLREILAPSFNKISKRLK